MEGKTILILKSNERANPQNYKAIACFLIIYKAFTTTTMISQGRSQQLEENNRFPEEQIDDARGHIAAKIG